MAYDASSGEQLWKRYTIATEPKPTRTTSTGLQLYGPAGGAVWAAPVIDEERGVLYVRPRYVDRSGSAENVRFKQRSANTVLVWLIPGIV